MLLKLQNYHSENIPTIYKKLNSFYKIYKTVAEGERWKNGCLVSTKYHV